MKMGKTVASALVIIIVACAGAFGISLDEGVVTDVVGVLFVVASVAYGIYKDHDFTTAARTIATIKEAYKRNETEIVEAVDKLVDDYRSGKLSLAEQASDDAEARNADEQ